jgi:hypothetical protein
MLAASDTLAEMTKKRIAKTGLLLLSVTMIAVFLFVPLPKAQWVFLMWALVLLTGVLMVVNIAEGKPPID